MTDLRSSTGSPEAAEALSQIIRSRRTCKNFDAASLSRESIEKLLELGVQAPNHRLNEPWKFRVITKSGTEKWLTSFKAQVKADEMPSFDKYFEKLPKLGAVVVVTNLKDENPIVDLENYAAACCAVQNILLAATSMNIQNFWSTGKFFTHSASLQFLKISVTERFVGALWLGKGEVPTGKPRTPAKEKTIWIE
ncbi:MAG: nitroreductase family protein [Deltaproteobacteria bacterium]|nr:nitroreductase family protein [Deltaproteobacteria bacterium]